MGRVSRAEVFDSSEVAICHVFARVVRRCFLLGNDPVTGKNYDHRKVWIEQQRQRLAANFGIDLLCFSILSNHFHLILRSVSFGKRAIGRLSIDPMTWTILVRDFGRMFCQVAGNPKVIDEARSRKTGRRFYVRQQARELLASH